MADVAFAFSGCGGTHTVTTELSNGSTTVITSDIVILDALVLGNLPNSLSFTYRTADHQLVPPESVVTPLNVGNSETLHWSLTRVTDCPQCRVIERRCGVFDFSFPSW